VALGAFRASGDLGFFAGTALSIAIVAALGGEGEPGYGEYAWTIVLFATAHAASTAVIAVMAHRAARPRSVPRG
jgi:hypothetical protein